MLPSVGLLVRYCGERGAMLFVNIMWNQPMAQPDHAPFHQGQDAFERGEGVLSCPYETLLEGMGLSWLAGWDEARRYAARLIPELPVPGMH